MQPHGNSQVSCYPYIQTNFPLSREFAAEFICTYSLKRRNANLYLLQRMEAVIIFGSIAVCPHLPSDIAKGCSSCGESSVVRTAVPPQVGSLKSALTGHESFSATFSISAEMSNTRLTEIDPCSESETMIEQRASSEVRIIRASQSCGWLSAAPGTTGTSLVVNTTRRNVHMCTGASCSSHQRIPHYATHTFNYRGEYMKVK